MAGLFMLQMSAGVGVRKSVIVDNPPSVDISVNPTTVSAGRNGNVFDVVAADSTVSDDSGKYKQFHSSESGRMELTEPGTILSQADSNAINHRRSKRKSTEPRTRLSQDDSALLKRLLRLESEKPAKDRKSDEELAALFALKTGAISSRKSRMGLTEPKTRLSPADSALLTKKLKQELEKPEHDRKSNGNHSPSPY